MTSDDVAISVRGLGKSYQIAHKSRRSVPLPEAIMRRLRRPLDFDSDEQETFWALKDVSFEVRQGEVLGIIGRNGAGKSTLLKLLSRITGPTTGEIDIHGRIASLLEVGTGFHPELSGRENVFLNGAILGMSRREIAAKFDEIVEFAEVEKFLDTPVKRYSSGMYVRLAFAVAAHLSSEILVLDEVLAVGDGKFQKKCLLKMEGVAQQGRTVLLVSHQLQVVHAMASRAILLDGGKSIAFGSVEDVVATYLGRQEGVIDLRNYTQRGSEDVRFVSIHITTADSESPRSVESGEPLIVRFEFATSVELKSLSFSMEIVNADGTKLFSHSWQDQHANLLNLQMGNHSAILSVPTHNLRPGPYWLNLLIAVNEFDPVCVVEGIELPSIVVSSKANVALESRRVGVVYVDCEWQYSG